MGSKSSLLKKTTIALSDLRSVSEPEVILSRAEKLLAKCKPGELKDDAENTLTNALTLQELDKGSLLAVAVRDVYRALGIDLMRKFQAEHNCMTPSEKATAELAALSFVRVLDAQRRITDYLDGKSFTDIGVQYLGVWSKELDRANRHFLTTVQVLRSMKQLPLQVKVTADTAIIGQNQLIQANNND